MARYAEINTENIVVNCIVADAEFVTTQTDKTYVEYNDTNPAGIGWNFDGTNFIAPQPFPSWTLDSNNDWQPPTPMPSIGGPYRWSEEDLEWVAI